MDSSGENVKTIEAQIEENDVDTMWNTFKTSLLSAVTQFVPHRTSSARDRPPWITPNVKKLLKARDHLFKKTQQKSTESRKLKQKSLKKSIHKATKEA